jgi:uncharacterized protein YciI
MLRHGGVLRQRKSERRSVVKCARAHVDEAEDVSVTRTAGRRPRRDFPPATVFNIGAAVALGCRTSMFVIELIYKADLTEIDAHMAAHVRYLKKHYAAGHFLVSGRKIPRDGGIILAVANDRQHIERIAAEDPFYVHGLADFRIIEFRASQRADDIQRRIERS